jgi:hypothetical protein
MEGSRMINNVNLYSSIIPGLSIGDYTIGAHISLYKELLSAILVDTSNERSLSSYLINSDKWICLERYSDKQKKSFGKVFYYRDDYIRLQFNSQEILYCIYVSEGFHGKLADSVGIGSELSDVRKIFEIEYIDSDEMYFPSDNSEIQGISFRVEEDLVTSMEVIKMISVHNWELDDSRRFG